MRSLGICWRKIWIEAIDLPAEPHTIHISPHSNICKEHKQRPKPKQYEEWLLNLCGKRKLITQYNGKIRFIWFFVLCRSLSALTFAKRIHAELTNSHSKWIYSWQSDFIFLAARRRRAHWWHTKEYSLCIGMLAPKTTKAKRRMTTATESSKENMGLGDEKNDERANDAEMASRIIEYGQIERQECCAQ